MNTSIRALPIVLALCAVLASIPSGVYAKMGARQELQMKAASTLQRIKFDSASAARVRWHQDRGTVRSLYNLTIPAPVGTPETSARQCLSDYCDLFAMTDPTVELRLKAVQNSLTGRHIRFHQYHRGVEVYGASVSVHINRSGQIRVIHSNYFPQIDISTSASLSAEQAISIALAESGALDLRKPSQAGLVIFPARDGAYHLAYRVIVHLRRPLAGWEYIIDAHTGAPLHRRSVLKFADGRGRVFNPNPVVALKDLTLMDQDDSAEAIPDDAYTDVILPELDGTGYLDGRYVSTRLTPDRANEPTLEYNYLRDDPRFEEVMVYYHVDAVGRYLKGLGFDFVDDWQLPTNVHVNESNNAFYDDSDGSINFGDGGVDTAEDAEVIIHEYGHAILDRQVPNIYIGEGGAIHEGFSDFLAASFYSAVSDGFGDTIVFDWAGLEAPEFLTRPVDGHKHYPEDLVGRPHDDGEMWSASLWELFQALGRDGSIRLVIESHFYLSSDAEFVDGASALFTADQELNGGVNVDLILSVMENRGFLTPPKLAADTFEPNDTAKTASAVELPFINGEVSIHTGDDADHYQFQLAEPMQVGVGIDFQPIYGELMLTLTGPTGVALVSFETKAVASLELEPGDYLVAVSGVNGATNDYQLALIIDNHGDTPESATAVAIGDTVESFIEFSGDTDFFSFDGEQGELINITVKTDDSDLDSLLVVYGPDGVLLAKNDDVASLFGPFPERNPSGIDSRVNEELPADGTYLLAVSNIAPPKLNAPFGGVNYSYTLSITENVDDHAPCGSGEETPLVWNEPVTGVINLFTDPERPFDEDADGFRFDAAAGDVISLHLAVESSSEFAFTTLRLLDELGNELLSTQTPFDGSDVQIEGFEIGVDGGYCVEVSGRGSPTDEDYTYTLTLSEGELQDDDHDSLRGDPTPIAAGMPVEGVISFDGDADAFQFDTTAGAVITLDVELNPQAPFFGVMVTLYDANLELLAESIRTGFDDMNDEIFDFDELRSGFTIPADGTYYVEVTTFFGESNDDSSYTLTLTIEGGTELGLFPPYDVNQDGRVDVFDLVLVGQHFGETFINATPTADFGQPRSVSPEGELRLLMTPSVTDRRQLTVSIDTTAIADLYGYHFSIQYDSTVLELMNASPSPQLTDALQQSYWNVAQQGTQLQLIQTRQGTKKGVAAEGALATLIFEVKQTQVPTPPVQLVSVQLADSLTRAIPVDLIAERVSMTELFPDKPMLMQNYPNPFNPETWIPYQLSTDSEVVLSIYDSDGEPIRRFDLGYQHVGTYSTRGRAVYWDGRNNLGETVSSGIYFYHLNAGDYSQTRKMLILK